MRVKRKHAGGRPRKVTPEVIGKLIEGFKDDFTVEEACRYAGIHKDTYYEECKRNPRFADEMEGAQDYPLTLAKKTVIKAIKEGSAGMSMTFLERRQRDRYATKTINQLEGKVATYTDLDETPKAKNPEDARRLAERDS